MSQRSDCSVSIMGLFLGLFLALAGAVQAQTLVVGDALDQPFDNTESWAMAAVTATTLFLGDSVPTRTSPGRIEVGIDLNSIPHWDTEERRVGLNGIKLDDLNKSPVFGRVQLRAGLPWNLTASIAWTPPVSVDGVEPDDLFAISLERPLHESQRWQSGVRLYAQSGQVIGDISCSAAVAGQPPGSATNPFGCQAPSRDVVDLDYHGLEISAGFKPENSAFRPFAALAVTRMDLRSQIDAAIFNVINRAVRTTEGTTHTASLGLSYRHDDHWQGMLAVAYTPLDIRRPPDFETSEENVWSLRLGITYRIR